MYSVNDINFHPIHGTFSTCGSDGGLNFWNKEDRIRLKGVLLDIANDLLAHIMHSLDSIRTGIWTYHHVCLQPDRIDIRLRRFVRLVERTLRDDRDASQQNYVACV